MQISCNLEEERILLFGGTFDPPHNGHINNFLAAVKACDPTHIIVMPAGIPPHKQASATPAELRYEMCACFEQSLNENPDLKYTGTVELSSWEMDRAQAGLKSYTVYTLQMLQKKYPDARIYMVIGSDSLLEFQKWFEWRNILSLCALVVQSRKNGDFGMLEEQAEILTKMGAQVILTDAPAVEAASSDIRSGALSLEMVPKSVCDIILNNHLYGR